MSRRISPIEKLDIKLAHLQMRLDDLYRQREDIEEELEQKGLKLSMQKSIRTRLATIDDQIKLVRQEDWDADDERYNLLYHRRR